MTPVDDNEPVQIGPDPDKLFVYHRQQLSAMLDGELSPDEARFMLRRLQHDTVLASCWERWQVCGDLLRGQRNDLLPADFAQRVAQSVAGGAGVTHDAGGGRSATPRMLRWGGGAAVAASVALLAVFAGRQLASPDGAPATSAPAPMVAELAPPASTPAPTLAADDTAPDAGAAGGATTAGAPLIAEVLAPSPEAGVALAETPRRAAERRSRSQEAARTAAPTTATTTALAAAPQVPAPARANGPAAVPDASVPTTGQATMAVAAVDVPAEEAPVMAQGPSDPFAMPRGVARPWPRSLLPAVDAYTVSGGALAPREPVFEPFLPGARPVLPWPPSVDMVDAAAEARQP